MRRTSRRVQLLVALLLGLIGFRTQHRAQTHGTYKFLFNALLRS